MTIKHLTPGILTLALVGCVSNNEPSPNNTMPQIGEPAFTLSVPEGTSTLKLTLLPTTNGGRPAFVDINGNGQIDKGEEVSGQETTYTLTSTQLKVYGDFESLDLKSLPITKLEGNGLSKLLTLNLAETPLSAESLSNICSHLTQSTKGTLTIEEWRLAQNLCNQLTALGWGVQRPDASSIDLSNSTLIIKVPAGMQFERTPVFEFEGAKDLWLDKNLNGVKDEGEALPTGGGNFDLTANLPSGESVYLFHGTALSLSAYVPEPPMDDEEEEEAEEEEADEEGRSLRLQGTSANLGIIIDASRFGSLQAMEVGIGMGLQTLHATNCDKLATLSLAGNPIQTLSLPTSSVLKILQIGGNMLQSLDLSNQPMLSTLSAPKGTLKDVKLAASENLININLSENQLTQFTLPKMSHLKTLNLKGNQLTTLSLQEQKYEALETFNLEKNNLAELDLNSLIKTKIINVSQNPLTKLQLPQDLKELNVSKTQITALDLNPKTPTGKAFIQKLDASGNDKLTALQLSECTNLTALNLMACPALTTSVITTALPTLPYKNGVLQVEASKIDSEASTVLSTKGWTRR